MNILKILGAMYLTLLGPIVAGVMNSIWCKTGYMKCLQVPMDGGKCLKDGKRIFGENKTWKGFWGYVVLNTISMVLLGLFCKVVGIEAYNMFYQGTTNTMANNLFIGFLLGVAYGIFELPNSFMKRRLGIVPGKSLTGIKKAFFVFLDQADSVFGCVLVLCFYHSMTLVFYLMYVVVGAFTHIVINMLLYLLGLRKNMF